MSRVRAAVLIGVHVLVAAHVAHWIVTGRTLSPIEPSEAMELSKHSIVNAGAIFFGAAILLTALLGRFFCGWGCHIVALQDLCRALLLRVGIRPRPLRSRALALVPLAAFLYMFVYPFAWRVAHRMTLGPARLEATTSDFWATFPGWPVALVTFAVCGFATVYLLGAKGFCTYACPYGAAFGLVDRLAPGRIRVTDACEGCGHCTATCSSNVDVAREVREHGMVVDAGCMKCLDCVSVCPKGALYYGFGAPALLARPRVEKLAKRRWLPWRDEAIASALFLAAFFAFRGLYGLVPFLLALGLAGSLAFLYLTGIRLLLREPTSLPGVVLVRDGKTTRAGRRLLVGLALFAPLWGHSAFVQGSAWFALRAFDELAPPSDGWLRDPPDEDVRRGFERVRARARIAAALALRDDPAVLQALAWGDLAAGDRDAFLAHSARAVAAGATSRELLATRAQIARAAGRLDVAAAEWERVIRSHPRAPAGWSGLAEVLVTRGATAEARAVLERAVQELPESARLRHDLAVVCMVANEPARARAELERALALDPAFLDARVKLATIAATLGERALALDLLAEGVRLEPARLDAHRARVDLAAALQDVTALRAALDEALARFPDDAALSAARARLDAGGR